MTYEDALHAYRLAKRAGDFPAALAAVKSAPKPEARERFPDGTLDRPYLFIHELLQYDTEPLGGWTKAQGKQLRAACSY